MPQSAAITLLSFVRGAALGRHITAPNSTGAKTEPRGLTLLETLVSITCAFVALTLFSGAAMMFRRGSGEDVSKSHMVALFQAHEQYANSNSGKQWCAHLDNFGSAASCSLYLSQNPCPPQQILGFDANGGEWGFWLGGSCAPIGGCWNWPAYLPGLSGSSDWTGTWTMINVRSFHNYLDGRFYDETFYAPNDTATYAAAAPYFSSTAEFSYPPSTVVWSSYAMSLAAMWHPDVFRGPANGGYQSPTNFPSAYTRSNLASAAFPELKSLMFEKNWNQSPPAGAVRRYNASAASRPVTLFYDGRVGNISNLIAIVDDARVSGQSNDNLWCRNSPSFDGYYTTDAVDGTRTSHSVLTTRGILGRDVLDTRCRVGANEIALLFSNWGGTYPDIMPNGIVDGADLTRVLDCWGSWSGCEE